MKWWPPSLKDEACDEAYQYFDKNVRLLPKNSKGEIDEFSGEFADNDVDAFRHAYVSGRFTQEYGETVADIFGRLNEIGSVSATTGGGKASTNMDYWNNAVGRKYGKKTRKKETLLESLLEALRSGEMILNLKDSRKYNGTLGYNLSKDKPVIVLKRSKTGRNLYFYDLATATPMSRAQVVSAIKRGGYPGYRITNSYGIPTPVSKSDGFADNNLG